MVRDELTRIIEQVDHEAIERARSTLTSADVRALTAWYEARPTWDQRIAVATLLQDQAGPDVERLMLDVLRAPGQGDVVDLAKAAALGILDEEHDTFGVFYNDRELLDQTVQAVLADHGLALDGPAPEREGWVPRAREGEPPLIAAIMNREPEQALDLLHEGADPNVRREVADQSALYWAATTGQAEVVAGLLEHGAEVDACDRYGASPLGTAASSGNLEAARALIAAGANVRHAYHDGRTVLMFAIRGGSAELVRELLDRGADPHAPQPDFPPLAFACFEGTRPMVAELLRRGADPSVPVASGTFAQTTPLMFAAKAGKARVARMLLEAGADPHARDASRRTARDLASGRRAAEICALLAG